MTATTEPRGGLDLGWDPGEDGWGPAMNANLLRLSRFGFHASVLSMTTTAPPGSPTNGAGYIIPSGASGAWAGKAGQVAVWDGSAWAYAVPRDGWTAHVVGVGLAAYEDGVWSQANAVKPAAIGAEPYAGAPAQTSFWRSTAAGARAWVQLIAADIADLATTLAGYLPKNNPTFTGTLTGPALNLSGGLRASEIAGTGTRPLVALSDGTIDDQDAATFRGTIGAAPSSHTHPYLPIANPDFTGALRQGGTIVIDASRNITGTTIRAEADWSSVNGQVVAGRVGQSGYYSMRRGEDGSDTGGIGWMASAAESSEFRHSAGGGGSYQTFVNNNVERLRIATDGSLLQSGSIFLDASRNITGTTVKGLNAAGIGIRPAVALADGTFDDQDAATFRGTIGAAPAPSRATISASTSLGSVPESAIYIPATDVNLTLTGGVDGQAWDIFGNYGFGLAVPSGTTLYAYNGVDTGPTTRNPGGGRAIRIVRLTATTWLAPNMSW